MVVPGVEGAMARRILGHPGRRPRATLSTNAPNVRSSGVQEFQDLAGERFQGEAISLQTPNLDFAPIPPIRIPRISRLLIVLRLSSEYIALGPSHAHAIAQTRAISYGVADSRWGKARGGTAEGVGSDPSGHVWSEGKRGQPLSPTPSPKP